MSKFSHLNIPRASLTMEKILVTGADGFIGSHLVEILLKNNYEVKAMCQYNSIGSWGWLDGIQGSKSLEVVMGDIRDPFFCEQAVIGTTKIIHLAALISIPYSYVAPSSYIETNINGSLNLCNAALKNKCKKYIQVSTSEVYGTAKYVPIDENHPLQPQSPYSASKIGSDSLALSFYSSFNLPVVIARPFNTFGPRQSARAIIPNIISQLANGVTEVSMGDVSPTRDMTFVEDTCFGLISLLETEVKLGEVYNIGSNFEVSIQNIFDHIKNIMKVDAKIVVDKKRIRPASSEVYRLWCDNSKLIKNTNFKPKYDFLSGLSLTVEWFKNADNLKKYKSNIYNV